MTWLSTLLATEPSRPDDPAGAPNAGDGTLLADADPTAARELDATLGPDDVALDVLPSTREGLHADHAARLSSVVPGGVDREGARDAAEAYAKEGVGAGGFAATYAGAVDELVAETFDMVRDGRVDEAEAALRAGLDATLADAVAGLERYDELAARDEDEYADAVLTIEEVLEAIPYPVYMLDADNRVIGWNYGHTALVGMDREEAMGKTAQESVIKATYSEGARKLTLADKVIDAPYDAHEAYDVEKVDTPYSDHHVYKDTSTATTLDDEEIEIVFWAVPIFDDDDDLVGVFEMLDDRTDEVRRREAMESLVGEVTDTLHRIGEGQLTARAEFEGNADALETELLDIVDAVNEMAADFQSLVAKVNARTGDLAESIGTAAEAARRIDDQLDDQNASLRTAADEMDDFSATMEEIAATSNEVASAAEQARAEVESGIESARDARAVADTVSETSASLVETVSELSSRMDEIEQVVEVISDVADQTNMLALNANIEAARAGEAGSGFAVVADQVKDLADETQSHTEEIAEHIERMEAQSRETVDAVERSHDQVNEVDEEIRATVDAFEEIADAVETAALDIEEVAEANDDQAARIEEATSMIREARDEADRVTATADTIVEETADGQEAVDELTAYVAELTE